MSYTLERFAASCHDILKADLGPVGRGKVCLLLEQALQDESFVATHLTNNTSERTLLYEDPELGFCILAHVYQGPKDSAPHDHGPSWAIYGQAGGETQMTDWKQVEPTRDSTSGKVRRVRTYTLTPGMAHLYNEGEVHSPSRSGPTRLIRIEGRNMEKVQRSAYQPA
jgi:predicted metal-dependent enzyme (double-stranded beta helix superfamily)